MLVQVDRDEGTVLAASGSIDFYSAGELLERAERELRRPECRSLSVDLCDCSYISFEGVAALIGAREVGRRLSKPVLVVGCSGQPRELLELTGALDLLAAAVSEGGKGSALER